MSETHAHTAKAQADAQTGKPHIPPGHVEADRPGVERLDDRQVKPMAPYLTGGAVVLAIVVAVLLLAM